MNENGTIMMIHTVDSGIVQSFEMRLNLVMIGKAMAARHEQQQRPAKFDLVRDVIEDTKSPPNLTLVRDAITVISFSVI